MISLHARVLQGVQNETYTYLPIEAGQASLPELARAITAFHSVTYAAYGAHARDESRVSQLLCINSHLLLPTLPFFI